MKVIFYGIVKDHYFNFHEGSVIQKYLEQHNEFLDKEGHLKLAIDLFSGLGETFLIDHKSREIPIQKNIRVSFFSILDLFLQKKVSIWRPY